MPLVNVELNAGTMLALHIVDAALRRHLKGSEIIWSHMRIQEHDGMLPGFRQFTIGDGLVHVPGTETVVRCNTGVQIRKDGEQWRGEWVFVGCMPSDRSKGMNDLPPTIKGGITFYHFSEKERTSPRDKLLPPRQTRFPILPA